MGTDSAEKLIEIGVVGRPHGVDGGVRVFLHNPNSATIIEAPALFLEQPDGLKQIILSDFREGNRCYLARFKGIVTRGDAEMLKGGKILVSRSALSPPEEDEFYVADLIGLIAYENENIIGRVASSRSQGGVEVIRIIGDAEEVEVPLVEDFVEALDISSGRVLLKDIEGLPRSPFHRKFTK